LCYLCRYLHAAIKLLKKILIIRFSSIGDIVLTSPVIRCVARQIPDAELHVLTRKSNRQLFEHNPYINKIHCFDGSLKPLIETLKKEQFDFVADLHKNLRSMRVRYGLKRPSAGFPKLNLEKYLLVQFGIDRMPKLHIVDRYFKAVEPLGVQNDGLGLDYFLPPDEYSTLVQLKEIYAPQLSSGFYAVVIGGKHNTKILPVEKVTEVCKKLDLKVILLGGPEDRQRGEQIASFSGAHVTNSCGLLSLHQSAWLLKHSRAVLTNDTGLMHIAAAFGKPVVSVWGNTVISLGMTPYMPGKEHQSVISEVEGLKCRPCSKIGYERCPKGHFHCMMKQDSGKIASDLLRISR